MQSQRHQGGAASVFPQVKRWHETSAEANVSMRLSRTEEARDAADYLPKAFNEGGHVADRAEDGEEGLALALDGKYDVLIVDRMLPKRDGLSVINELRAKGIATPV